LVKTLSALSTNQRLKTALGGFVSFTGFIILVIVILTATGAADMKNVFQNGVMVGAVAFLGFIDVFCGVLLVFREKRLKNLFASQKKKTSDDIK
jgi:formate hydrogenlyase subunit 3/multisubunit Na+/H+ antiporter MnhD subunit